nr:probable mannitol dehydrogenase [Tanacetum cinerariifolium]
MNLIIEHVFLGHVAVKLAKAFGAQVTVFSTTTAKKQEALEGLKADHFIVSKDAEQMQLVLVGVPEKPLEIAAYSLIMGRKIVTGSATGGLKETQEMLDFAAKHGITADIELIPIDYVNTAMERILKSDVKYRFVIDVANSLKAP